MVYISTRLKSLCELLHAELLQSNNGLYGTLDALELNIKLEPNCSPVVDCRLFMPSVESSTKGNNKTSKKKTTTTKKKKSMKKSQQHKTIPCVVVANDIEKKQVGHFANASFTEKQTPTQPTKRKMVVKRRPTQPRPKSSSPYTSSRTDRVMERSLKILGASEGILGKRTKKQRPLSGKLTQRNVNIHSAAATTTTKKTALSNIKKNTSIMGLNRVQGGKENQPAEGCDQDMPVVKMNPLKNTWVFSSSAKGVPQVMKRAVASAKRSPVRLTTPIAPPHLPEAFPLDVTALVQSIEITDDDDEPHTMTTRHHPHQSPNNNQQRIPLSPGALLDWSNISKFAEAATTQGIAPPVF